MSIEEPLFGNKPLPLKTVQEMMAGRRRLGHSVNGGWAYVNTQAWAILAKKFPSLKMKVKVVQRGADGDWTRYLQITVNVNGEDLVLEDDAKQFPSDQLLGQLMLVNT